MRRRLRGLGWNSTQRRPRAPWRLLVGAVVLVAAGVAGVLAASALAATAGSTAPPTVVAVVGTTAQTLPYAAFIGGIVAAAVLVDRRRLRDFGLARSRAWWADLGFGLALGVALPGLVFAVELAAGFVTVSGFVHFRPDASLPVAAGVPAPLALALVVVFFVGVGVFEELLFRGYLLRNVAEGLAGWRGTTPRTALSVAAAVTSVLFGAGHAANPSATVLSTANIVVYGGLFAASYLLTDRLGVAIGLHIAWNFAVSSVFGFPVSGFTTPVTLVAVEQSGPPTLTGGPFGPEGGLVALVGLAVGAGALAWWVRRTEGELRWREAAARPTLRAADGED